jgi:hypothetical protein
MSKNFFVLSAVAVIFAKIAPIVPCVLVLAFNYMMVFVTPRALKVRQLIPLVKIVFLAHQNKCISHQEFA